MGDTLGTFFAKKMFCPIPLARMNFIRWIFFFIRPSTFVSRITSYIKWPFWRGNSTRTVSQMKFAREMSQLSSKWAVNHLQATYRSWDIDFRDQFYIKKVQNAFFQTFKHIYQRRLLKFVGNDASMIQIFAISPPIFFFFRKNINKNFLTSQNLNNYPVTPNECWC